MRYKLLLSICVAALFVGGVNAQEVQRHELGITLPEKSGNSTAVKLKSAADLSTYWTIDPMASFGHSLVYENPEYNFVPQGLNTPVGDLNGDGVQDFIRVYDTADERTDNLSDQTAKTLIFFGGSDDELLGDEMIYERLMPVGDLLGKGKSQLISLNEDQSWTIYDFESDGSYSALEHSISIFNDYQFTSFSNSDYTGDINGDGFGDIVKLIGRELSIIYAVDPVSQSRYFSVDVFDLLWEAGYTYTATYQYLAGGFLFDGTTYLVVNIENMATNSAEIVIVSIDSTTENINLEQVLTLPEGFLRLRIQKAQLGTGMPHLLVSNLNPLISALIEPSDVEGQPYNPDVTILNNSATWVAGDVNNDGAAEFIESTGNGYELASYDGSLQTMDVLPYTDDDVNMITLPQNFDPQGDINGDGIDDIQYAVSNSTQFGQVRINGKSDLANITASTTSLLFNAEEYALERIERTFGIGDVTGDGQDEYAMLITAPGDSMLKIFEGGGSITEASYTIDLKATYVNDVISGNFSNSEEADIALFVSVSKQDTAGIVRQNEVQLFNYGAEDPYRIITAKDYQPDITNVHNFIGAIATAGDVNNDGFDDLLVSAPAQGIHPVGLYYGGSSMSINPDVNISFTEDSDHLYNLGWGGTLKGNIDLNGDDISDFMIVNIDEYDLSRQPLTNPINNGVVHIFFGEDGEPDFNTSDVQLRSDSSAHGNNIYHWMFGFNEIAVGDFNGDEYNDVAVKAFYHSNFEDINDGRAGIHIFHGGEDFDDQYDQLVPVMREIHQPITMDLGNEYTGYSGRAYLAAIPDVTGDGSDELIYIGPSYEVNGSIYFGGEELSDTPDVVLKAPNQSAGFNMNGNYINRQYNLAIGDFVRQGVTTVLVEQPGDRNYKDTPAYMYEVSQMTVGIENEVAEMPSQFRLEQNYPNPFNPVTNIGFTLPEASVVRLTIYNILGQQVQTIVHEFRQAGSHEVSFNASSLSSGIYFYKLNAAGNTLQRRMTLIK